jgi:predicted enzyme related to lactoylglutathione lyase
MTQGVKTIIYPAPDLERAKAVFMALVGTGPTTDAPYYVGFTIGDQQIGLDPGGHTDGPVAYWHVHDITATVTALVEAGATLAQEPKDVGGGRLIGLLTDPAGSTIGLLQDTA